jgi:hypothetical protein
MKPTREVTQDVLALMKLAAMDDTQGTEHLLNGRRQRLRSVNHEQTSPLLAQATINEIAEHVPRDARLTQEFLFPSPTGVMWSHGYLKWRWRKASEAADVPIVPVREGTRHSSATAARREQ